ncbi:MAG: sugar phosphate isomerase/epimerase family protein [Limnochordia bacterium]
MLFGASTMTFFRRPILEALEAVFRCGFDYAEIWVDHAWDERQGADNEAIRRQLERLGLRATVHCPILDINITSANRGIRRESVRQNLLTIDFAREVGAQLVVIHPGSRFSARESLEAHWDYQIQSIKEILAYAEEQGVMAAVENMDSGKEVVSVKDREDLKRLFTLCERENGLVTLDTTHLGTTEKVLEFIDALGSQIAHLHLSDALGDKMHLRLGEGNLDLRAVAKQLQTAGYTGVCSLECFVPNDEGMLKNELAKARELFSA